MALKAAVSPEVYMQGNIKKQSHRERETQKRSNRRSSISFPALETCQSSHLQHQCHVSESPAAQGDDAPGARHVSGNSSSFLLAGLQWLRWQ